jgi:osmoprotectant transport system permease protein
MNPPTSLPRYRVVLTIVCPFRGILGHNGQRIGQEIEPARVVRVFLKAACNTRLACGPPYHRRGKEGSSSVTTLQNVFDFIRDRPEQFTRLLEAHVRLSVTALLAAMLLFVPIGIACAFWSRAGGSIIGILATVRVIPSLALILLMYPWLGLGFTPSVIALTALAGPPLLLNSFTGVRQIDAGILEAATGLGMTSSQRFWRVQLPLAVPVILAGVRTAAVEVIASATLASFVGVRTFGQWIVTGISLLDRTYLLAGAFSVMALVLAAELLFGGLARFVGPNGQS